MKQIRSITTVLLVAAIVICLPAMPCMGELTVDDSSDRAPTSSTSDDDSNLNKSFVVGFFVIVVVVFLWLGLRMDREWSGDTSGNEALAEKQESGPSFFMDLNSLPEDKTAAILDAEPEAEIAARVGLEVRF